MKFQVRHVTTYAYSEPVSLSHHLVHLSPRADTNQQCESRELKITPQPPFRRERVDAFQNRATYFSIEEPHRRLSIEAACEVIVTAPTVPPLQFSAPWENVRDRLKFERRVDTIAAYGFTFDSAHARAATPLVDYAGPSFKPGRPLLEAVMDLTARIFAEFTYDQQATNISTPVATVLRDRRGVCQDFSHLQIAALRSMGLAARYVSGYVLTRAAPGKERLVGADASHAWVSVYLPDFGWVDFDPTNGLMPAGEHITLAAGRDFADITPVRGVILGGGAHDLVVTVDVTTTG